MIQEFIVQNWVQIIIGVVLFIIFVMVIEYRKQLAKKIKNESISFVAMCISLGLAIAGFYTKSTTQLTTLAYVGGERISLFIPIFWGFLVIFLIALIIFFRKELAKPI